MYNNTFLLNWHLYYCPSRIYKIAAIVILLLWSLLNSSGTCGWCGHMLKSPLSMYLLYRLELILIQFNSSSTRNTRSRFCSWGRHSDACWGGWWQKWRRWWWWVLLLHLPHVHWYCWCFLMATYWIESAVRWSCGQNRNITHCRIRPSLVGWLDAVVVVSWNWSFGLVENLLFYQENPHLVKSFWWLVQLT